MEDWLPESVSLSSELISVSKPYESGKLSFEYPGYEEVEATRSAWREGLERRFTFTKFINSSITTAYLSLAKELSISVYNQDYYDLSL